MSYVKTIPIERAVWSSVPVDSRPLFPIPIIMYKNRNKSSMSYVKSHPYGQMYLLTLCH